MFRAVLNGGLAVGIQARRAKSRGADPGNGCRRPRRALRFFNGNTDIESLMQAEMTSSLLTAILESSDEAIITKTLDGVVTSWNSVAVSLLGYSAEEAIGMNVSRIIPSDRLAEEKEILLKIQRGVRVDRFESMRLRKDGSLVDVSLIVVPV